MLGELNVVNCLTISVYTCCFKSNLQQYVLSFVNSYYCPVLSAVRASFPIWDYVLPWNWNVLSKAEYKCTCTPNSGPAPGLTWDVVDGDGQDKKHDPSPAAPSAHHLFLFLSVVRVLGLGAVEAASPPLVHLPVLDLVWMSDTQNSRGMYR